MKKQEIMLEINKIEETFCNGCTVKRAIRKEHGPTKELKYCHTVCKYGRTLVKLGVELVKAGQSRAYEGPQLYPTLENYEKLDRLGIPDMVKLQHMKINSIHTLWKYKKDWGIAEKRKQVDLTLPEYQAMSRIMHDTTIAVYKGISKDTLQRRKREWGV